MRPTVLKVAFVASLLINMLLVGVIVGGALRSHQEQAARPDSSTRPLGRLRAAADQLTPENRRAYRQTMIGVLRDIAPLARASQKDRREAAAAFSASNFDPAAVGSALARSRQADIEVRRRLESALIAFSATLSPEERRRLGEGLARGGPFRRASPTIPREKITGSPDGSPPNPR
jgi:uncharacterized membrane protein